MTPTLYQSGQTTCKAICKAERNSEVLGPGVFSGTSSIPASPKARTVCCWYKGHLSLLSESNPALASCRASET